MGSRGWIGENRITHNEMKSCNEITIGVWKHRQTHVLYRSVMLTREGLNGRWAERRVSRAVQKKVEKRPWRSMWTLSVSERFLLMFPSSRKWYRQASQFSCSPRSLLPLTSPNNSKVVISARSSGCAFHIHSFLFSIWTYSPYLRYLILTSDLLPVNQTFFAK